MAKYYYNKYNYGYLIRGTYYKDVPRTTIEDQFVYLIDENNNWNTSGTMVTLSSTGNGLIYVANEWVAYQEWNAGNLTYILYRDDSVYYKTSNRYKKSNMSKGKGSIAEANIIAEDGTYPENGLHSDGYWYIKGNKASLPIYQNVDGEWKEITNGYVKINGEWKEITNGYQKQDGSWKKLFQEVV